MSDAMMRLHGGNKAAGWSRRGERAFYAVNSGIRNAYGGAIDSS